MDKDDLIVIEGRPSFYATYMAEFITGKVVKVELFTLNFH